MEYHRIQWEAAYGNWIETNQEAFGRACRDAARIHLEEPIALDRLTPLDSQSTEELLAERLFLEDLATVTDGTYMQAWSDDELVIAGQQLCTFLDRGPDYLHDRQNEFQELRTSIVYQPLFDAHPPANADFDEYMVRWAGPDWSADFAEFGAALTWDASHLLVPGTWRFT